MSTKTARKDNTKYLGKDGTQAWRVSTMIDPNDDKSWHACMIYDEALIPAKGKNYEIELTEEGDWKNWKYKLQTKKEQILEQTAPPVVEQVPPPITEEMAKEKPKDEFQDKMSRGASWNNAFMWCLKNRESGLITDFLPLVAEIAEQITKHQSAFVNNK